MQRSVSRLEITGLAAGQSVDGDQQVFGDVDEHDGDRSVGGNQRVCRHQSVGWRWVSMLEINQ